MKEDQRRQIGNPQESATVPGLCAACSTARLTTGAPGKGSLLHKAAPGRNYRCGPILYRGHGWLAAGVDKLIRQMRAEQKVVREWADEQAQQQHELAAVLRQITDKAKLPAREERK